MDVVDVVLTSPEVVEVSARTLVDGRSVFCGSSAPSVDAVPPQLATPSTAKVTAILEILMTYTSPPCRDSASDNHSQSLLPGVKSAAFGLEEVENFGSATQGYAYLVSSPP